LEAEIEAMGMRIAEYIFLGVACFPFAYYLLALYSAWRFFHQGPPRWAKAVHNFTPRVSILKPVRGLDAEAYENFASFCALDYPEYETVFCAHDQSDPSVAVIERLAREYPERTVRVVYSEGHEATNDKVAKLVKLLSEARHEVVVLNDSDVRVRPDYLRSVVAPLADPHVGGVTCLYVSTHEESFAQKLQSIGMISDFYPGIMTAWQLDGVKFGFGQTIATTRERIAGFGGFEAIENRPADDLLTGRLIAEQGFEMVLLPYAVVASPDFGSFGELLQKRLRWMTVMRHMRPWGHVGLVFTQGLAWALAAIAVRPTWFVAAAYLGTYAVLRVAETWLIGVQELKQQGLWEKMPLIVVWDALAFTVWLLSFGRNTIRWRQVEYRIRDGQLEAVAKRDGRKSRATDGGPAEGKLAGRRR
jgi:ceramide glucosyltransferase